MSQGVNAVLEFGVLMLQFFREGVPFHGIAKTQPRAAESPVVSAPSAGGRGNAHAGAIASRPREIPVVHLAIGTQSVHQSLEFSGVAQERGNRLIDDFAQFVAHERSRG